MSWIVSNSEVIAGILGVIGSFVLALPLLSETTDRKHWETLQDIRRRAAASSTEEQKQELRDVRDQFLDERLGDYERHRQFTVWGVFALGAAFVFLIIHAIFG